MNIKCFHWKHRNHPVRNLIPSKSYISQQHPHPDFIPLILLFQKKVIASTFAAPSVASPSLNQILIQSVLMFSHPPSPCVSCRCLSSTVSLSSLSSSSAFQMGLQYNFISNPINSSTHREAPPVCISSLNFPFTR